MFDLTFHGTVQPWVMNLWGWNLQTRNKPNTSVVLGQSIWHNRSALEPKPNKLFYRTNPWIIQS